MASTHVLRVADGLVTKRYTDWRRGEHRREWAVLCRLRRHAAGLAPEPVRATLDAVPPTVTMTLVPGRPLTDRPGRAEVIGLATALRTLWSVPLGGEPSVDDWADDLGFARPLVETAWPGEVPDEIARALAAATAWWRGPDPALLRQRPAHLVLGHRDPNLANYLWDGYRVRIVDFEDARASDPVTELALLAEHLSARHLEGLLGQFDVDEHRLRAARRLWSMFWLFLLRPGGPAATRNPKDTARLQARRVLHLLNT
ncbi:phosphotransferase [Asanoa sp. NPDC049518]|uniref:phosphotransferase n=1 Tax=unclassified Asanoa TaxID=2685164 RepID=UPI00341EE001